MPPLRLAILGCGGMARSHASRFDSVKNRVQIVAAVDVLPDRAKAVADLIPGCRPAQDYRQVLDDVDAVLVVLPHHLHHPVGMDCLAHGKHVLMEKPLANTEAECLDLIAASKKASRVLMVAYCMRFHPLVTRMKELIAAKTYGQCFQVSIWTEQHTQREPDSWMCRASTLGGGQLFSHGCHYIDILLWYLGAPVKGVHVGSNCCTPWMEREGTSNVTLTFENGAMGYHFGTWGARGSRLRYSFHAHCEQGMIEAAISEGKLYFHQGKEATLLMTAEAAKPTDAEMAHFLDCIETGREPITNGPESLQGLRLIWRLYEAEEKNAIADLRGLGLAQAQR
ncbi:MAG TPA: Gfo/Idh/MocA family oxidoreductase [Candidatus Brocadiia bacterium]|nr:Gfo/Idh/MocA family oxidoreductase [Candidatus Brocadiia bacterium]